MRHVLSGAALLLLSLFSAVHLASPRPFVEMRQTARPFVDEASDLGPAAPLLSCPPGRYGANASGTAQLRAHWRQLVALGYIPRSTQRAAARRSMARGFVTYESGLWPRPPHCSAPHGPRPPRPVRDEPPGTCEPDGRTCNKYRVSRRYRFVWHHVWKGGTTSLSPYLSCNMDALPVPGLLRALPAPLPGYLQVGTAREPLKRFISAFQEVYSRVRLKPRGCLHRNVPWLRVAMGGNESGCAPADEPLPAAQLLSIFRQFVRDVQCSWHFPNVEHLYTQSLFLGGNTSVPQPVDLLLRLESLDDDIERLKRAVGYRQADTCPLRSERVAADKPRGVPSQPSLRALLEADPALLQDVCNVYMQDYLCLGYPLPRGCEVIPSRRPSDQAAEPTGPPALAEASTQQRRRKRKSSGKRRGAGGRKGKAKGKGEQIR